MWPFRKKIQNVINYSEVIEGVKASIVSKNPYSVDRALKGIYREGTLSPCYVPILIELLKEDWHYKHEDVVFALQGSRDSRAVEILYETAVKKYNYLSYNNSYALARKCTWALADIGTHGAREKLILLSKIDDEEIANYAKKRLDNWEIEKHRKNVENTELNPITTQPNKKKYNPDQPWKIASTFLWLSGFVTLFILLSNIQVYLQSSVGISILVRSLLWIAIYIILGIFVGKKNGIALKIAIAVYIFSTLITLAVYIAISYSQLIYVLLIKVIVLFGLIRPTKTVEKNEFLRKHIYRDWNLELEHENIVQK